MHRRSADPRLNLSRRKSAAMAGAPTDQARVCLAVPPPGAATLLMPSTRASRDSRCVTTRRSPQLGKLGVFDGGCSADLRWTLNSAQAVPDLFPAVPRGSPQDLAHIWHVRPLRAESLSP